MASGQPSANDETVDDLDDLLEDFKAPAPAARAASPAPAERPVLGPPRPPDNDTNVLDDDFMKAMQAELAELMGQLGIDPESGAPGDSAAAPSGADANPLDQDKMLADMFEQLLKNGDGAEGEAKGKERAPAAGGEGDFQEQIRRTMEKMKLSDDNVKAGLDKEDDPLAAMLKMMTNGQSEDDLREALEGMMGQLLGKDLLQEPLEALMQKYPSWLAENRSKLPADELARYEKQMGAIKQILAIFHSPSYSDDNAEQKAKITELMQVMQECGAPPRDVMGEDLPDGVTLDENGMPNLPSNCPVS